MLTPLELTNLNNEIVKCGFPEKSLNQYLSIFNNLNIKVEIINKVKEDTNNTEKKVINIIKNCDIDNLTPLKAFNLICKLKEML